LLEKENSMGRLDGKVALISGGARGQGATEATLFAREGARVVFGDVLDEAGRQVEADIRAAGGEATYVHLDVTSDDDWREAVGTAVNRYGKLDILVNNAGIIRRFSIEETTREVWDEVMAVNSTGVFLGTKYAIPAMRQAGGGSIVNISSISGIIAIGAPAYNASKGAVRVFTKVTAVEHARDKIRCNSIHPGPIDTAMLQSGHEDPEAAMQRRLRAIPLGRLGTTEDIAYGALYLASDESSFVTGAELVIDGGFIAQ
jgi:NAD(P)-dependent dehydrogenase (short-subunit alcohol dehydrogenase family)